jgi:ankyrin repeat protein
LCKFPSNLSYSLLLTLSTARDRRHDALQAALFRGRARIVQTLLKDFENVNVPGGHFGNAIQAAAFGGHDNMLLMMLKRGADVNSEGRYGSALRAASLGGHDTVVRLLLDSRARIGVNRAVALQAAALNCRLSTGKLLQARRPTPNTAYP